jgi:hypothetical protein
MAVNKKHQEFATLDMTTGWEVPAGYPPGVRQKVISGALDEQERRGTRTRLLQFDPGAYTSSLITHDYWEEVYVVSGELIVGNDAAGAGGQAFPPNTYACRPPHVAHGPFKSATGCLLFEIHYYDPL